MTIKYISPILILVFAFSGYLHAQQIPVYNHYVYNPYLYNPAEAGADSFAHVYINHRAQWLDIPDGPVTNTLTFDMPFKGERIGIGAMLYQDKVHIVNRFGGMVTYAYHLPLNEKNDHRISIGVSAGILNQRLNILDARVTDANDNAILSANKGSTTVDFSAGLRYQWKGLRVGVAVPQVAGNSIKYTSTDGREGKFGLERHYLGSVSYRLPFGVDQVIAIEPSVMVRYIENLPIQIDGYLRGTWDETIWVGVGYRSTDAAGAIQASAGFRVKDLFSVTYSYEMVLDKNDATSLGTSHEVLLGIRFGNKKTVEELDLEFQNFKNDVETDHAERDSLLRDLQKGIGENRHDIDSLFREVDSLQTPQYFRDTTGYPSFESGISYKKIGFVLFEQNSYELTDEAVARIQNVADLLNNSPNVVNIYLQGRASTEGGSDHNFILSTRRAVAVKNQLKRLGVSEDQIILIPYGEEDPVTDQQATEEERSQNRRVDIFIVSD